jgi:hypothetical protein
MVGMGKSTWNYRRLHSMILSIDPSINHVGVALRTPDIGECIQDKPLVEFQRYWQWFKVDVPQVEKLQDRLDYLVTFLPPPSEVSELVIEYPMFMGGSDRGNIAAQKGYTIDLGCVCGYLMAYFQPCKVHLYKPNEWKGQMPKDVIGRRFERIFGVKYKTVPDHCYEATMMLYWHLYGKMI